MSSKKTLPYFTVVIPCLNEAEYLPRLLTDLGQQTFTNFEVIVVDGYSTDHTIDIAQKLPHQFPLTCLQTKTRNVSFQRNLGAKRAVGKALIFFDADTQIPKSFLHKLHYEFETHHVHMINTWVLPDSNKTQEKAIANGLNLIFEASRLIKKPTCCGAMIAVNRKVFEDVGGFDTHTPYAEDTQFSQTVVKHNYKYRLLTRPRYIYSLRRIRREGTLELLSQFINLSTNLLRNGFHDQKVDYPMGGDAKALKSLQKNSIAIDFQRTIDRIRLASKTQRQSLTALLKKNLF